VQHFSYSKQIGLFFKSGLWIDFFNQPAGKKGTANANEDSAYDIAGVMDKEVKSGKGHQSGKSQQGPAQPILFTNKISAGKGKNTGRMA
jgi:hypothetical protein